MTSQLYTLSTVIYKSIIDLESHGSKLHWLNIPKRGFYVKLQLLIKLLWVNCETGIDWSTNNTDLTANEDRNEEKDK